MNCKKCNDRMIWCGDMDIEEVPHLMDELEGVEGDIVEMFECEECGEITFVLV